MSENNFTQKILELITEEQILQIISEYGANPVKIKPNEIWFRTICHGGNSHKLCYFRNSKEFYCYTNCGKMNLFTFIMNIKDISFGEAVNFLKRKIGISSRVGFQESSEDKEGALYYLKKKRMKQTTINKDFNMTPIPTINDTILNYFEDIYYKGWIDEGITIPSMQKHNIKWYGLEKHIIIPHYNINGELVGIRRRTLQEQELREGNKYMPETIQGIQYAHSLNMNLYGLDKNKKTIQLDKRVIITESEKSVLLSDSYYDNQSITVATCGFNISSWHKEVLMKLGVREIILAFDKDFDPLEFNKENINKESLEYKKYIRFCERLTKFSNLFHNQCKVSVLWDERNLLDIKDSPFDKGKQVFEELFKYRVNMSSFENLLD